MRIINKGLPCEHYVMTTASRLHLPPAPVLLQSSFNSNTITDRGNLKPLSQSTKKMYQYLMKIYKLYISSKYTKFLNLYPLSIKK